ncbi:MAG: outer membrane beta-barrel protein [Bacteroidia bacterium]|nr:outer membrane beta-barrel protein [Bacteroidia bacterium]
MKKSVTLLLFTILFFSPVFSQIKFGIKIGGIATLAPIYDIPFGSVGIEPYNKWNFGIRSGVFLRINSEVLYFQPEAAFEYNTIKYTVINNYTSRVVKQSFNKLDIPLLLGAQFDKIRFCLGPSASIKIVSPKALVNDVNFDKLYGKIAWEYQIGFGVDLLEKVNLEARYRGYLGKDYEGIEKIGYQTFTLKKSNASFIFSISYVF